MNFDPVPYPLGQSFLVWLIVMFSSIGLVAFVSLLGAVAANGVKGVGEFTAEFRALFADVFSISLRRVGAITLLTFREAVRRKALLVFVIFAILFMFAGWFLSSSRLQPEFQVPIYVSFVLRAISWLILPVVLLLSCWGIPEDIRLRSLHTVVTKPTRRIEVVLGRIAGFGAIGLVVLAVMSVIGWGWINRQLSDPEAKQLLTCRQPVFGEISFIDREGNDKDQQGAALKQGINVGDIWMFHSYIEGASKARAIWSFDGITPAMLDKDGNLKLESRFKAFRSHKGDMQRTIHFQYTLVNPETKARAALRLKTVDEFRARIDLIPRDLSKEVTEKNPTIKYDLFETFVTKAGRLIIEVSCTDQGQYLGMARPDLFIRTPDAPFWVGYFKAIIGMAAMVLLIVILGVTASTFVKGPVATLLTFSFIVVGQVARDFMGRLVGDPEALHKAAQFAGYTEEKRIEGAGMLESIYRIVMHMNPTTPLPENVGTTIMTNIDNALLGFMWLVHKLLPNFGYFDESLQYVANGFDVPFASAVVPGVALMLAYFIPCVLLGNFALRVRELEAK